METLLRFNVTYNDGTSEVQEFRTNAAAREAIDLEILKAMGSYGTFGLLKKLEKEGKWVFVPANRIARIEVNIPVISLASGADADALKAGGSLPPMIAL
jgi:hypothetical protein